MRSAIYVLSLWKLGIDVDSAADIVEARLGWKPALYDLVLINMERGGGQRDKFCDEVRSATPPQRLAFLVGQPEYLAFTVVTVTAVKEPGQQQRH